MQEIALNTPARTPAEAHAFAPGHSANLYHHGAGDTHVSDWLGPATLIRALLVFLVSGTGTEHPGKGRAFDLIRDTLEHMAASHSHNVQTIPSKHRTDILALCVGWRRMVVGFLVLMLSEWRSAHSDIQP